MCDIWEGWGSIVVQRITYLDICESVHGVVASVLCTCDDLNSIEINDELSDESVLKPF